jgi:tRNA threonylcarbamoyladenosine biosynthesis protein TsaE
MFVASAVQSRSARFAEPPVSATTPVFPRDSSDASGSAAATRWTLPDAAATGAAGRALAPALAGGMVVSLSGDLGAGKTTIARGVLRGLGWTGPVKSPTYTLVEHYRVSSLYLYHFDFYRFADPSEWDAAGFSEYFRPDALCLVEWPERVQAILGRVSLALSFTHPVPPAEGRLLAAVAGDAAGTRALRALADSFR